MKKKKKKNKFKSKRKQFLKNFKNIIKNNKYKMPLEIKKFKKLKKKSWFRIKKALVKKVPKNENIIIEEENKNDNYYCQKIEMILSKEQKKILNKWFLANTHMYNETLLYIKTNFPFINNNVIRSKLLNARKTKFNRKYRNHYYLRKKLYDKKKEIIKNSQCENINKNTKIYTHILDYSIKQVCTNLKSAESNLLRYNIKRFRMKYWKNKRPSQTIDVEKQYIKKNKICPKILGDIKYIYNKKPYFLENINNGIKINYNLITEKYTLLVPHKYEYKKEEKKYKTISLDPGLRTFMTGLSENNSLKIGNNIFSYINKKIRYLNKLKLNKNIPKKIIKKNEKLINRKIYNKIDELHWKTIKYLTDNYTNILLGDMSAKSIVSHNRSVLSKSGRTSCLKMRFFDFRKRLEYKCKRNGNNYKLINENYSSKTCSNCGNYNYKLTKEKIYNCSKCYITLDRDINACRNIFMINFL